MAAPRGTEDPDVNSPWQTELGEALAQEPFRFSFFQAVRMLERLQPQRSPLGYFGDPQREVARFGVHPSTTFPPSELHSCELNEAGAPRFLINFMGLIGAQGVLPITYTELVQERGRARDRTLRDFLDIFQHRMISLFYRAWEKYRFPVAYERDRDDRFSRHLMAFIGMETPGLQNRQPILDWSLVYYTGLLALQPRSAAALAAILGDYFDVPVDIDQFIGRWRQLDEPTQCCFEHRPGVSEQVGLGAVVGDEIWDQNSGVRVVLGPLTLKQYRMFLPNGSAYYPLQALLRFFGGDDYDFEVQMILRRDEVPYCELNATDVEGPQLGWTTWAKSQEMLRDPGDTILRI